MAMVVVSTTAEALLTNLQVWHLFSAAEIVRMHGHCAYAWLPQLLPQIPVFFTLFLFSTCTLSRCLLLLASGLCYRSQSLLKSSSSVMLERHYTLI